MSVPETATNSTQEVQNGTIHPISAPTPPRSKPVPIPCSGLCGLPAPKRAHHTKFVVAPPVGSIHYAMLAIASSRVQGVSPPPLVALILNCNSGSLRLASTTPSLESPSADPPSFSVCSYPNQSTLPMPIEPKSKAMVVLFLFLGT